MDSNTKSVFTNINKEDELFSKVLEKITKKEEMTYNEYSYALSLSLLFYDEYLIKEKTGFMEFSYYLVLNYSLNSSDYSPLLMFSINNGLYPIAKCILNDFDKNIQDIVCENGVNSYKRNDIYELKKQFDSRKALIESNAQNRAYIAPTSYGKSSAIIEDISKCQSDKIGIIVPKKALIWQTFRNIKTTAREFGYKVLLHDSDYLNENKVICVFTQERAIRLIQDSDFSFDVLYIDEAHNLFEKDERNVLLARLIKLNKKKNQNQKIVYLSPLIKDANDLSFSNNDFVEMHKIEFNIKELRVRYLDKNGKLVVYNRFVDKYYETEKHYSDFFDYIFENKGDKNLLYFNKPKDIENFSQKLMNHISSGKYDSISLSNSQNIIEISNMIEKYVDKNYKLAQLLKYGIVYIHGKMPDAIKDYIINKFINTKELKFLISNSSVLEGMNLSIDTMFIFDVYGLKQNNLINLCGRVNRLSDVFSNNNLFKLLCDIHFIDIEINKTEFKRKISMLRSDVFDDVKNPLLSKAKLDEKGEEIVRCENEYINNYLEKDIGTLLIKNGIANIYKDINLISKNIASLKADKNIIGLNLLEKISKIFFHDCSNVNDYELARLGKTKTIEFYTNYINKIYHKDLKSKVGFFNSYFNNYQNENYYIGQSFGEIPSEFNPMKKVYVNIKSKSLVDRVNFAVIKTKIEDDFIGYKLGKLVKMLLDLELIDETEYNEFVYGTNDEKKLLLLKMGLSPTTMKFIEENALENEYSLENGAIKVTNKFTDLLRKQDDYMRFEIGKFINHDV